MRIFNSEYNTNQDYYLSNSFALCLFMYQTALGERHSFHDSPSNYQGKRSFTPSSRLKNNSGIVPWKWDNLNLLVKNKLYCLSPDLTSVVYEFDSYPGAAKTLTPLKCFKLTDAELLIYKNIRHIHRNINTATLGKYIKRNYMCHFFFVIL